MKNNKIIEFYKKRWFFFSFSLLIMLAGIIGIFVNGVRLDVQFKGGAILQYSYVGKIDADVASDVVSDIVDRPVTAQITSDMASNENRLVFTIAGDYGLDANDQISFDTSLKEKFPDSDMELSESSIVEPFFGQRFLRRGILSILLSALLVMMYVWVRFRKMGGLSAGVMALVALLHDVLIVFFTCVLFQIPIGDSFIAVALGIIGYSINDTIVIYDRIRENSKTYTKLPVDQVVDLSISQSMTRSINTSIAVFISVGLIYVLAVVNSIESIQSFALPMAIGSISGCYSTICVAGPLWVMWKKRKEKSAIA